MNTFHNYVSALRSISKNVKARKVGSQNEVGILWRFATNNSLELIYDTIGDFNIYPMGKHLFIYKSIK